jgi:hypothetical protein
LKGWSQGAVSGIGYTPHASFYRRTINKTRNEMQEKETQIKREKPGMLPEKTCQERRGILKKQALTRHWHKQIPNPTPFEG